MHVLCAWVIVAVNCSQTYSVNCATLLHLCTRTCTALLKLYVPNDCHPHMQAHH